MRARVRDDGGFGMIELLLAMVVLNVALLAVVAALNAGIVSLTHASRVTTASVLADQQMERYREITYASILLDTTATTTADSDLTYRNDTARGWPSTTLVTAACSGPPVECNPSRTATGADKRQYRIDTYIVQQTPTGGRPVKVVTVVVRDGSNLARTYVRQASTFDQSTG